MAAPDQGLDVPCRLSKQELAQGLWKRGCPRDGGVQPWMPLTRWELHTGHA